ncbi:hypothetical protein HETIRDRAFT_441042 [Heterobasidion irregulare TC 32-1]|uniref:Uncharacterized protein n=1 Tax=Heterobasidion irregulare (strain TC 32-1) TaxID=747525 RepID=W4JZA6_HETIT|nr:uncharacterized protein HETIRDRAFT_441042 [Heterobasidion irregulare TC 32-1]ETW78784.1 hypothetical protein HETIRDRAFT_441042 [Heterobasidion irregulare TC 32-1]
MTCQVGVFTLRPFVQQGPLQDRSSSAAIQIFRHRCGAVRGPGLVAPPTSERGDLHTLLHSLTLRACFVPSLAILGLVLIHLLFSPIFLVIPAAH